MPAATGELLNEIIRRIVNVAKPERIILFGSHARETAGPDSDFDLLVIVRGPARRRKITQEIYMNLIGAGHPADVVVCTVEDIERYKETIGTIIPAAIAEGKVIYAA